MTKALRSKIILFVGVFFSMLSLQAQVTTNSGSGLAPTYASLDAAITALNAATITSPVVITLTAANPQTAPAGGYELRAEGTATNTIKIIGNGNTITASSSLTPGALNDGLFKVIGGDYISIESFVLKEAASNTIIDAGTNNMTEWGVAVLYASPTNGSQNVTIRDCTIDLDRTYQNTFGIYSNSNHSATAVTSAAPATSTDGNNSGLSIFLNSITDVNIGIVVIGSTLAGMENDGVIIGGSSNGANTITNYGTTNAFSGYANVSGTVNGILIRCSKNFSISHNTITSSDGGVTIGNLRGIYCAAPSNPLSGSFTNNISNNTISLKSGNAISTSTLQGIFVETTTANSTAAININNNNFTNLTHTVASAAIVTGILNTAVGNSVSISGNTFTNISASTTGNFIFIQSSITLLAGGTQNVNDNSIVTGFTKTGAGGTVTLFTSTSNSPIGSLSTYNNNNFSNITVVGATIIAGWISRDGVSTIVGPTKSVNNNTFTNWTSETGSITVLTENAGASGSSTVSGNTISNISGGGTIFGIALLGNSNANVSNNLVHSLTGTGGFAVNGISTSGTFNNTNDIKIVKNKIYNLTNTNINGTVNGIIASSGGTAAATAAIVLIANNIIGDLKAPIASNDVNDVIRGINITATSVTSNINVFFNTVYINATSTGAHFGTTGVYHANSAVSTTATLEMSNNIILNTSTAAGLGQTVAYKRSAGGFDNYAEASNFNIFYAGVPSTMNLIYYDGNNYSTLADYKLVAGVRETMSKTENVPFASTIGSDASFLHINTGVSTQAENGGVQIIGIADDFDGNVRSVSTPDIGADEFTTVLPVALVNFTGTIKNNVHQLSWTTLTETNNSGFEILRSNNGITFNKLAFVASKANNGNSANSLQYTFTDELPLATNNYYQLKQVDKDGKVTFSKIVLLKASKSGGLSIVSVYPNPVKSVFTILVNNTKEETASLQITDYAGKVVSKQSVQLINGSKTIQLNAANLPQGNYTISIVVNNAMITTKFIKQ